MRHCLRVFCGLYLGYPTESTKAANSSHGGYCLTRPKSRTAWEEVKLMCVLDSQLQSFSGSVSKENITKSSCYFRAITYRFQLSAIFSSPEPSGSQGELIVYPYSGVRRRRRCRCRCQQCLNIFSSETAWPIKAKFLCGASLGRGNESLYKCSRSHDQDGRHAHI